MTSMTDALPTTTGDIPPSQSTSLMTPSPLEASCYYTGLPSRPLLVARTGTTPWESVPVTGPEEYLPRKELRPVGNHAPALKEAWEGSLPLKLHALLDLMHVKWTSIDVVRIGIAGDHSAPVILWIGVMPRSLFGEDGLVVASRCQDLLVEFNIIDVDVEIRESIVTRSVGGPKLLPYAPFYDPTVDVRESLTTSLGIPICAQSTPWAEGTGGFFISEGGNAERLLLVTARHPLFMPESGNEHFEQKDNSQSRHDVMLFSDAGFNKCLKSIIGKIRDKEFMVKCEEERIRELEGKDDPAAKKERERAHAELDKAMKAMKKLRNFHQDILSHWATAESRVLGHVILSPPISTRKGYTEDWAVIEIDTSKIDASNFEGNTIDLGTRISVPNLARM
ncbi:hypothetical protein EI94DRAFT_1786628, partial [Lactarius quietus]